MTSSIPFPSVSEPQPLFEDRVPDPWQRFWGHAPPATKLFTVCPSCGLRGTKCVCNAKPEYCARPRCSEPLQDPIPESKKDVGSDYSISWDLIDKFHVVYCFFPSAIFFIALSIRLETVWLSIVPIPLLLLLFRKYLGLIIYCTAQLLSCAILPLVAANIILESLKGFIPLLACLWLFYPLLPTLGLLWHVHLERTDEQHSSL